MSSFLNEFAFLFDVLLSFLIHFHFLDLAKHIFWWNVSYFFFSSSSSIWLNFFSWWIFIFCSSLLAWMIFRGISCLLWLLINHYFPLITWWKFLHSLLFYFSYVLLKSFLAWWQSFFSLTVWYFLKTLSLFDGFSSFLAWCSELSLFFDELSFLNLMNLLSFSSFESVPLSSSRTLPSGA